MSTKNTVSRRSVLKAGGAAVIAVPFVSRISWAEGSPMGKIQHAGIGAGGKGGSDIGEICGHPKATLIAAADVDTTPLGRIKKSYPQAQCFRDYRQMLTKLGDKIDTVSVSTPDHMHAIASISAMNLGKHVYCQKPLTQSIAEGRALLAAAKRNKVVVQMGTQLASGFYERMAVHFARSKAVGEIKEAWVFSHKGWGDLGAVPTRKDPVPASLDWDLWLGVAAERDYLVKYYHPKNWRRRQDFGTGTLGDMGCHMFSPVYKGMALTAPISIYSETGVPNKDNWTINEKVEYVFPATPYTQKGTVKFTWVSGRHKPPKRLTSQIPGKGKIPKQGSILEGTEGILMMRHGSRPELFPKKKFADVKYPKLPPMNHYRAFVDAVIDGKRDRLMSPVELAVPMTEFILLGTVAMRCPKQTLTWNAKKMLVEGNDAANKCLRRTYRKGWETLKS